MSERVVLPAMMNEIKNAKQGDVLVFDGKRWIPATFDSLAEKITATINKVSEDTQKTLMPISTKLDKLDTDFNEFLKAFALAQASQKRAYAVSMAFNKIAIDELVGDSECEDFGALKDWYADYINGTTDTLSQDKTFTALFNAFMK